jgi:hypothetical protein
MTLELKDNLHTVPLAERTEPVLHEMETVTESVWFNPQKRDQILDMYIGINQRIGRPPRNNEERTGIRRYIIRAGEKRALPVEFDIGIQQTQCYEPGCNSRPNQCKDGNHQHAIIGGQAPKLVKLGVRQRILIPALDDLEAARKKAEEDSIIALHRQVAADQAAAAAGRAVATADARLAIAQASTEVVTVSPAKVEESDAPRARRRPVVEDIQPPEQPANRK